MEINECGGASMEKESGGGLLTGLLVGGVIGVGLGLLYAPRPGRETREMIRQRAENVKSRAEELGDDLKEKTGEIRSMVRERVHDISHAVKGDGSGKVECA